MTNEEDSRAVQADMGPISLNFEVPMYVCSGLAIRFLRVVERGTATSTLFRTITYFLYLISFPNPMPPCMCRMMCAMLSDHAHRMLIGACNPMLCPIHVS